MRVATALAETLDLLQKSIFAPLTPQLWGEPETQSPPELGDLGGIPGFMHEVYSKEVMPRRQAAVIHFHLVTSTR